MTTTNVISTPEITGNIGSCTTQSTSVPSKRLGFFKQEITYITTNSCTGEVNTYQSYAYTPSAFFAMLFGFFLLIGFVVGLANS